jgi:Tfp pilus tip-associated adhesin PilY1
MHYNIQEEKYMMSLKIKHLVLPAIFILLIAGNGFASDEQLLFSNVPPNALIILDQSGSMNNVPAGTALCTDSNLNYSGHNGVVNNYFSGNVKMYSPTNFSCASVGQPSSDLCLQCPSAHPCLFWGTAHQSPGYSCSPLSSHTYSNVYDATSLYDPSQDEGLDWSGTTKYYSSDSNCSGNDPNYYLASTSVPNGNYDCSKIGIAKGGVFKLLDANIDNFVTSGTAGSDDIAMNVTMGYMYFNNCDSSDINTSYSQSGCINLANNFGSTSSPTKYSKLFCGSTSSANYTCFPPVPTSWSQPTCLASSTGSTPSGTETISAAPSTSVCGATAVGGTPLAQSLTNALGYIQNYASTDTYASCRSNFAILLTDGADTFSCNGDGSNTNSPQMNATVAAAYALKQAGYPLYTIGFGALPQYAANTLNWAAYWGGTQTSTPQTPVPTYPAVPNSSTACTSSTNPGLINLTGYSFMANSSSDLSAALTQAITGVKNGTYSFSVASVSTARITSEDNIYAATFTPVSHQPFWQGDLTKYQINADGSINYSGTLDAGLILKSAAPGSWVMKTLIGNSTVNFDTGINSSYFAPNLTKTPCNESLYNTNTTCEGEIINYLKGNSPNQGWKLGDIWHSNPVVITSPSAYFSDIVDKSTPNAFQTFRANNQRTSGAGRVVIVGANDGQLHVFETGGMTQQYSFVPPNLLPKLQLTVHDLTRTTEYHQYYVDGPISAADVWLGPLGTQAAKNASDWHTIAVFGEGRGVEADSKSPVTPNYLWSSSVGCETGFAPAPTSSTWNSSTFATYPYYCGYYAFDFTNMNSSYTPSYMWKINATAHSANDPLYLAEPWSKMAIGRMIIGGNERWVGIIGGGGYSYSCTGANAPAPGNPFPATAGRGLFVIDLSNGNVIWSFTSANNSAMAAIAAPPSIVDTDNDGYIDTAYVGDLAGNVWRFDFCTSAQGSSCNSSNWSGSILFNHDSLSRPIYSGTSIATDSLHNIWIYWGTGDVQCPAPSLLQSPLTPYNASDRLYAIIDSDRSTSHSISDLQAVTGGTSSSIGNKIGWYYNLSSNETMLSAPTVFAGIAFYTTFTPASATCQGAGTSTLYGFNYLTGGGGLTNQSLTLGLGTGIATSPLVSMNPFSPGQANLYVTVSGSNYTNEVTELVNYNPPMRANRSNMIYWKDRRVQ